MALKPQTGFALYILTALHMQEENVSPSILDFISCLIYCC